MPDDSAVGFGFQADIVSLSSLTHLITGRILKALSDGGIDFYAVAASMWLGKYVPVQSSLQTTLHSNLLSKTSLNGFLAKALSIGWGHSAVPIEMSRTKAGANALLVIGALSTGSSPYVAAQCLSELLTACGCEADKAPTVDVLKPLVTYLSPFVQDLGFPKVLEHITTAVSHKGKLLKHPAPPSLRAVGEPAVLAAAIKQLVYTSQKGEDIYLVVHQRGSWLAAFASHILGMEVEIQQAEKVLWATSGSNGRVVIVLDHGNHTQDLNCLQSASKSSIHLVPSPVTSVGQEAICIDYALSEALDNEFGYYPELTEALRRSIQSAIVRLSSTLLTALRMRTSSVYVTLHPINGTFPKRHAALEDTLSDLGIEQDIIRASLGSTSSHQDGWAGTALESHGLSYMRGADIKALKCLCPLHRNRDSRLGRCICCNIGGLIHSFSSTTLALLQARYDSTQLRLRADMLNGTSNTSWSRGCIIEDGECSIPLNSHQLLSHLSELLHGTSAEIFNDSAMLSIPRHKAVLGVSSGALTIYYTCILSEDCYDDRGRTVTISSGRACVDGVIRPLVVEMSPSGHELKLGGNSRSCYRLAPGAMVQPHYIRTACEIWMDTDVSESEIVLTSKIGSDRLSSLPIFLSQALHTLFGLCDCGRTCDHPVERRLRLDDVGEESRVFLTGIVPPVIAPTDVTLQALKGSKLEQVLSCVFENNARSYDMLLFNSKYACPAAIIKRG
ncbi:hypothetical protein F53441_6805 [Fusarium austroafricanum]|uniref:Uncharacterized protein n=1 Tax=Fusarium austroafricanum TaxID=2364996 RepID=A0A8H4KH29_9HYPO|nr:hypothetical protein F53441_6805 [Fusarium austroafricanum]